MIKLTPEEIHEMRSRELLLSQTYARLGQIDMSIAALESQRHQMRSEAHRHLLELEASGERAIRERGFGNGAGCKLDLANGVITTPNETQQLKPKKK
jgi:hypothetical protein